MVEEKERDEVGERGSVSEHFCKRTVNVLSIFDDFVEESHFENVDEEGCSAVRDERERDARVGEDTDVHADVHECLYENERDDSDGKHFAVLVSHLFDGEDAVSSQ